MPARAMDMVKPVGRTGLPRCPRCGSEELSKPMHSRRAMAWGLLLFGFPLLVWRKQRHCFDCGADFKAGASSARKE